jgi:uncharacterized protein YcnI
MIRSFFVGALAASLSAGATLAHVTLEAQEAAIGKGYKAVFRVPHGCDGSPTTSVRVKIPTGFIAVKPMPKSGWTIETVIGKYPKTYDYYHSKLTEGVSEIAWTGGKLPDSYYDEFVITGFVGGDLDPGRTLYFPVVQECEKGVTRWIDLPVEGKPESATPAPGMKLVPAAVEHKH